MGREVGRIVEVRGIKVKAELYSLLPPYILDKGEMITAPRINAFVKTKVGLDTIICQISGEYHDENYKGTFTGDYLELAVKGYFEGKRFIQGLRLLPMVEATIELLDVDEFKRINECNNSRAFSIGTDLFDNNQKCFFSYDSIIPSHIGVFGNTGSGKSNTIARLLAEYANVLDNTSNGKILILDINNEYGGNAVVEESQKTVYPLTTRKECSRKIPLNYDELQEDEWCTLLNATEATQRPIIKTAYYDKKTEEDYRTQVIRMIKGGQHQLVRSLQYHMADYIDGIQELKWFSSSNPVFYYIDENGKPVYSNQDEFSSVYDKITVTIPSEKLERFLFRLYFAASVHVGYGTLLEFISPLLRRAEKLVADFRKVFLDEEADIFAGKKIVIIQLANVNRDMTELIPSIIVRHMFLKQIEKKGDGKVKDIINVAIDEAHNLLYEDDNDIKHNNVTIETFEKMVKEGRKFGMFLWIASQRPSDISTTIISQMHNYFIHKLVNPNDLNRIRKAVAFLDQNAMDTLTVLGPGECVVSGTGVNMPCFIKVEQLDEEKRPNSENVKLFGENGLFE